MIRFCLDEEPLVVGATYRIPVLLLACLGPEASPLFEDRCGSAAARKKSDTLAELTLRAVGTTR